MKFRIHFLSKKDTAYIPSPEENKILEQIYKFPFLE